MIRRVESQRDLNTLENADKGWIVNQRDDRVQVHRSGCEAVGAMTQRYPKTWCDERAEAKAWLDTKFGSGNWTNCGLCGGVG